MTRFKTRNAFPPGGCYEYAVGSDVVYSKSLSEITAKASELRRRHGLETIGDPFRYVMDYMCPRLPNGFCTSPSAVKVLRAEEVRGNTAKLFPLRCVTTDEIERRLSVCVKCEKHATRGFCMGCTGLLDWIYRGFAGRRPVLPPDQATGACAVSSELVAASATVDRPAEDNPAYPDGCWRKASV